MEIMVDCSVRVNPLFIQFPNGCTERFTGRIHNSYDEYLMVPEKFRSRHWNPMPRHVTITPADGSIWVVTTHYYQDRSYLAQGWGAIVKHYGITVDDNLFFEFDMKAHLRLIVFRKDGSEKKYVDRYLQPGFHSYYYGHRSFEVTMEDMTGSRLSPDEVDDLACARGKIVPNCNFILWPSVLHPSFTLPIPPAFAASELERGFNRRVLSRYGAGNWPLLIHLGDEGPTVLEGWPEFVRDNKLVMYDACAVERNLIDRTTWNIVVLRRRR